MLKDLIRASFAAFRGAHRSVPATSRIELHCDMKADLTAEFRYTAPCDGLFTTQIVNNTGRNCQVVLRYSHSPFDLINADSRSTWGAGNAPLRKGETIIVMGLEESREVHHFSNCFYPYVGENPNVG